MTNTPGTEGAVAGEKTHQYVGRLRRFSSYAFWTVAAQAVPLGIDRLIVHPWVNNRLGEDRFGAFICTLAIVQIAGTIVANGIHMFLLRDLNQQSHQDARQTLQTALILTTGLSAILLAGAAVASYFLWTSEVVQRHWLGLFMPLCLFALLRALQLVLLAAVRIKRLFRAQFMIGASEGLLLLAGVVLLYQNIHDYWLLGSIYVGSVLLPFPLLIKPNREFLGAGRWWDTPSARWLLVGSVAGMLMTLTTLSQVYAARIALGVFSGGEEITEFYAGTSIGNIFVMPVGAIPMAVLSVLAGTKANVFRGMRGRAYVAVAFSLAIGIGLISYLCGPWIIGKLYPSVAPRTMSFYHWIVIAQACTVVGTLLRPAGIKYAPLSRIMVIPTVTLVVQLVTLAILVPLAQARGAAMSQTISATVGMVLWLLTFRKLAQASTEKRLTVMGTASD